MRGASAVVSCRRWSVWVEWGDDDDDDDDDDVVVVMIY